MMRRIIHLSLLSLAVSVALMGCAEKPVPVFAPTEVVPGVR